MSKNHWVIDYETLIDCTILVAEHYTGEQKHVFSISSMGNQLPELVNFLEANKKNCYQKGQKRPNLCKFKCPSVRGYI